MILYFIILQFFINIFHTKISTTIGINKAGNIFAILISFLNRRFIPIAITIIPPRKFMSETVFSVNMVLDNWQKDRKNLDK